MFDFFFVGGFGVSDGKEEMRGQLEIDVESQPVGKELSAVGKWKL